MACGYASVLNGHHIAVVLDPVHGTQGLVRTERPQTVWHIDFWANVGNLSLSLAAVLGLVALIWRMVVRPVWRVLRRLNRLADDLLGEPSSDDLPEGRPSLMARVGRIETALERHLAWHDRPGGRPADDPPPAPVTPRANSRGRR